MPRKVRSNSPTAAPQRRAAFEFDTDRVSAFGRARRHSALVRTLRLLLPTIAVGLVLAYAGAMQLSLSIRDDGRAFKFDGLALSTEALVVRKPSYEGFDKQGGHFIVRAETAEQDIARKGPVKLKTITGQLTDSKRVTTNLAANRGTFDTESNVLELHDKITVTSENGMRAHLTQATVMTKTGRIESKRPVRVLLPNGVVDGKAMVLERKSRQVAFSNGVTARLKPQPTGAKRQHGAAKRTANAGSALTQSDQPITITSEQLQIDDAAKTAVFSRRVVAVQGDATLRTEQLQIDYDQSAVGQSKAAQRPARLDQGQFTTGGRIRRLISKGAVVIERGTDRITGQSAVHDAITDRAIVTGPVEMTSGPNQRATSDRAEFDNKNETVAMTGDVVVVQDKNVLKGRRLLVDRKRGTMQMTSPGGDGMISAQLYNRDGGKNTGTSASRARDTATTQAAGLIGLSQASSDQPINIVAKQLRVDDQAKTATFRGKVRAAQGDYTIFTKELVARYSGQSGLALGDRAGRDKAKGGGAELTKVTAPTRVKVVTKDGRIAVGDTATFDPKANRIKLVGDVMLSQRGATTTGPSALLDLNSGKMWIVNQSGGGYAAVKGVELGQRRARVLIFPNQMKGMGKSVRSAKPDTAAAKPAAAAAPKPATDPRTSSWTDQTFGIEALGN